MMGAPLRLLCIEPRFPGRLGAVADYLVRRRGFRCQFYCSTTAARETWPLAAGKGLDVITFPVGGVARESIVPWTRALERGLCYAYGCWEALQARRPQAIDLVLGRSAGLGSTLFAPVALPGVPIVNLFDYFCDGSRNDLAAEDGPSLPADYRHWRRSSGAMDLLDLENGVTPWTLTAWQRNLYPTEYRDAFVVLHDGIDLTRFVRRRPLPCKLSERSLPADAKVVSFVARSLDRLRGFDRFLNLANRLLRADPNVVCVVAGSPIVERMLDVRYYAQDYSSALLAQMPPPDPERLWFLGPATPSIVVDLLAVSHLHVYPGRPYPVARSLLEAMAGSCVVLAADSSPVREFLTDGQTGLLVPAGDEDAWERQARRVLDDPAAHRPLGEAAAQLVRERYAQDVTLSALATVFDRLVSSSQ
jgi:glycosyltransferase involved in cell wall biosynthesis